jgi:hypothetical protein
VKWIPTEALAIYKAVDGVIPAHHDVFRFRFAIVMIAVTPLYIAFATRPPDKNIAWRQVVLAPIAFTCWAIAMQGDGIKALITDWEAWMGSIVVLVGTFLLPIFDGILKALGLTQSE